MSLKQLALKLGVSTATISNAFSRPDQLSTKLRDRILKEAEEVGFHGPNLASRMLRSGKSNVIGIMLSDSLKYSFSDSIANQMLQGVAEVLVENDKHMLLLSTQVESIGQRLAESLPDGFIFYGTSEYGTVEKPAVNRIIKTGRPVVLVDFELENTSSVNINNEQAAYNIAKHALPDQNLEIVVLGLKLIDVGRVCRLTQDDMDMDYKEITRSRLKGFIKAAQEKSYEIKAESVWHMPVNDHQHATIAAREALTKTPRPNILLCMSDIIALSAISVAKELKLNIPEDIVITGFDGIPEAAASNPTLTTVCQQSIEKGKVAAELLLSGDTNKQIILDTKIKIRNSSKKV